MAYRVSISARAERDLAGLFEQIGAEHSQAALEWYLGLREALRGLKEMPNRCPATPENPRLRHLLYGHKPHVYRVIYRVKEKQGLVEVLHIRHGARRGFKRAEL
ncbi:MAG: type II toxin-antitoxin system RelE/ParE family toxin [Terracidiphilus sp.]